MITTINTARILIKHISCDCNFKFDSISCNANQKCNEICQCECENYRISTKIIVATCNCENSRYLKSNINESLIVYDEIINFTENVSTNAVARNFISTVLMNSDDKKVKRKMDFYILHEIFINDHIGIYNCY